MVKRTNREIRNAIFNVLSDNREHSFGDLERKVNTNWKTVRDHIEYMELFGAVEMVGTRVKITEFGVKVFEKS